MKRPVVRKVTPRGAKIRRAVATAAAIGTVAGVAAFGGWVARNTWLRSAEHSESANLLRRWNPAQCVEIGDLPAYGVGRKNTLQTYIEGDVPVPGWWKPEESMAVEWEADHFVGSDEMVAHPPIGIDPGGIDYNIEPEVYPDYLLDVPMDRWLQEYIYELCEENGLPYTLAVAVIEQESHYTPWTISATNDYGLMQINIVCHDWLAEELGISDFLDPYQSARAGVYILSEYYHKFGYESGTLMAYNLGEPAATALFKQGIYSTDYSERVLGIKYRLDTEGR